MAVASAGVVNVTRTLPILGTGKVCVFADVTLTGNYTANGDEVEASYFGLSTVDFVIASAAVDSTSAPTLVWPVGVNYAADAASFFLILGESAADGDPLDEKPAEAVTAGTNCRVMVIGSL